MFYNYSLLILLVLGSFAFYPSGLQSQGKRNQGWSVNSGGGALMIQGNEVISSRDGFRFKSPQNLNTSQEIDYYLALGEFYLKRKDKVGIANILYDLRTKKGEYSFADALLTSLWKQAQGEDTQAIKVLDTYIQKEPNTYFRNLAKNMHANLFQGGEDEKKSMLKMDCLKSKPYYALCRVFRLQYYIDLPNGKEKDMHKQYVNIMRVASPFFEDPLLEWIPLLDRIDEDLPAKLAFLGLIREAFYFQNMIMDFERIADGEVSENSIERLSFFQTLGGDYALAEESLLQYLQITKSKKTSYTNRIYLKLGVLAFLQKDYKKSVEYYLKLDLSNWSSNILHPVLNEPITITGAKDLIAVSVWKAQNADNAIRALQKIQDPEKLNEDDIWPKLRLAQIIMDQNPEIASQIADEIIYMAAGKGWRRLEYAATMLQGYNQIYRKEFRKSTIEFTKSRGILDTENSFFSTEFIRNFGFVFAHTASGKRGPLTAHIREGISDYKNSAVYEDLFLIRNYRPVSFSTDQFWDYSVQFLKDESDGWGLLESLYNYELIKRKLNEKGKPQSLFQIQFLESQFKYLSGFHTQRESKFFDSTYVESRQTESMILAKQEEESPAKALETSKNPSIIVLPYKDSIFLFFYNPKESKKNALTWKEIRTSRFDSLEVTESVKDFYYLTKESERHQIYFNEPGLVASRVLKKDFKDKDFFLFYSMIPNSDTAKSLSVVSWNCPFPNPMNGLKTVETSYFEGSRILKEKERAHLWDFEAQSKNSSFRDLAWACKNGVGNFEEVSLNRLSRRIDYRTVPRAIIYSDKVLTRSLQDSYSLHLSWLQFWFRSGVKSVFYKPKWSYSDLPSAAFLLDPTFFREEGVVISQTPH
ncbi:tetratricopeptide repeat protein [Leptospira kobayashii]|nr:hypothetical protein [Leptospira kobayashii]